MHHQVSCAKNCADTKRLRCEDIQSKKEHKAQQPKHTSVEGVEHSRGLDVGGLILDSAEHVEVEGVRSHAVGLAHPVGKHATDAALGVRRERTKY